ncbi:hypothetical protein [Psychrobacter sp.]|uniref:hypothetical protein n=1 Tax=Psychrobacter sp. TaxID=56811 RepID=UPI0025EE4452|nr:hypothetical protein [Psychrobacter sp.]
MNQSKSINVNIDDKLLTIDVFRKHNIPINLESDSINIFASGPSVANIDFNDSITSLPSMFVNGSLSLLNKHPFSNVIAYVISDERFINNNPEILKQHYTGQPLYITQPVLEAIKVDLPNIINQYHHAIRVIYPVDRPLMNHKSSLLNSLPLISKVINKKLSLLEFKDHPDFVIDSSNYPKPIGVSLNVEHGFVEAGTVAFVAAQLAFTLGASEINLYGIDLINSNQPRFYESNDNVAPCKLDKAVTERIVPSFDLLAKEYKKHKVGIINHSPISKALFNDL